jgi:hypothetical protein
VLKHGHKGKKKYNEGSIFPGSSQFSSSVLSNPFTQTPSVGATIALSTSLTFQQQIAPEVSELTTLGLSFLFILIYFS